MSHFVIKGHASLAGSIPVYGSKNAAMPLIAATLLTSEEVTLKNIPPIADVLKLQKILSSMGVDVAYDKASTTFTVHAKNIQADQISSDDVGALRGSILLLGSLLGRQKYASLPKPGGDIIGARPIDVHLDGFEQLGAKVTETDGMVTVDGKDMKAGTVILQEFSVTATENILLAASTLPGTTTIHIAAAEPHVVSLCRFLESIGAKVSGAGTHTISITGSKTLTGTTFENIQDMLEAGTFMLLAAATKSRVTIEGVPVDDLLLFFKKLDDIGVRYTFEDATGDLKNVVVEPSDLKSFKIQTLPHPGIPTDLQAPFSVIATQVTGSSLIHDPLYEGRFKYIPELQKMGANVIVADPHRVIITGPTPLYGRRIPSLDLRAGATLLMAGLVADGETIIDQAEIIDRGYANLMERLSAIGASIRREED